MNAQITGCIFVVSAVLAVNAMATSENPAWPVNSPMMTYAPCGRSWRTRSSVCRKRSPAPRRPARRRSGALGDQHILLMKQAG